MAALYFCSLQMYCKKLIIFRVQAGTSSHALHLHLQTVTKLCSLQCLADFGVDVHIARAQGWLAMRCKFFTSTSALYVNLRRRAHPTHSVEVQTITLLVLLW